MHEIIYYNGDILTMEPTRTAEALLVKNGVIQAVGDMYTVAKQADNAQKVDLKGATLMPAFLDAHSHVTALASTMSLVPLSEAKSIEEIKRLIKEFIRDNPIKEGEWVMGFGYDHESLDEKRHPNKQDLDEVTKEYPLLITHASGHMGAVNSQALAQLGVTSQTPDPEGGKIGRVNGTDEPNGFLEENAFFAFSAKMPRPSAEKMNEQMLQAQQTYLKYGITTAQDGKLGRAEWAMLKNASKAGKLQIDITGYVDMTKCPELLQEESAYCEGYQNHLKLNGYKIFLDGSPQGRTAWMSQPYENAEDGYRGYPTLKDEQVAAYVRQAFEEERQILAHCNGDAAAQQYIDAVRCCQQELGHGKETRPVMIHAQTVRKDQLSEMRELGIIPSYFIAHTYYWGDVHYKNLGKRRAQAISPAKSTAELEIPFTFHQDTPVVPPDMLFTVWCAVNRKTAGGKAIGNEECITPLQALKAVTINAAYQYFEENEKGTLKQGKRADLVVLDQNPLKVPPDMIREIRVLQTIKDGKTVFEA